LIGLGISAGLYAFAPSVIRLALGRNFDGAIPLMRTLAFIPFLRSITTAVGLQGMMPFGHEHRLAAIYGATSAAGLALAIPATVRWGANGTAWVALLVEAAIGVAQVVALNGAPVNPLSAILSRETRSIMQLGVRRLLQRIS